MAVTLCPFCGAYSTRKCEIEDEDNGVECPWVDVLEEENSNLNAAIDERIERRRNAAQPSPEQSNQSGNGE